MVRTRATTVPTPTPARQGASEPTIGAVARGEQWQEAVVEVAGERPLGVEDKHLVQLVLGR